MNYITYHLELLATEKATKALFQAFVVLAGCFLIGAKDQGAFLYKEESTAYELKFKVEAANNNIELNKIDCLKLQSGVSDCNFAKYKIRTIESYTKAFIAVMDVIRWFLIISGGLCLASFLTRPMAPSESEDSNIAQENA